MSELRKLNYLMSNKPTKFLVVFVPTHEASSPNVTNLESFVTPDKKLHKVKFNVENGIRIPYLDESTVKNRIHHRQFKFFLFTCSRSAYGSP